MAQFLNPFAVTVPDRPLTTRELTRALRQSIAAEEEAIHLYEALADVTEHQLAKEILQEIANEEKVHVGEFQKVLNLILDDEEDFLHDGEQEVEEKLQKTESVDSFKDFLKRR